MSTRTVSKTISLDSFPKDAASKYITVIGNDGIKVHPYNTTAGQADTNNYVKIDSDGMEIWQKPTGTSASVKVAEFGSDGVQIGQTNGAHSVIDANGQRFYATNGTTQLANIGYGPGTNSSGGTSSAPYYTLGVRDETSPIYSGVGNYSVVEGNGNIASEYCSHAEGRYNASIGFCSHSEGSGGLAEGAESHTEGFGCHTKGFAAHAQNEETIASKRAQTALGVFNVEDTSSTTTHPSGISYYGEYAVIVGNGNSEGSRSNALTVDWSGNTEQQGRATTRDMTTGTNSELEDFLSDLDISGSGLETTQADWIVGQGTNGIWTWRKWQSGIAECWGDTGEITLTNYTTAGTFLYGYKTSVQFPTNLFVSKPIVTYSAYVGSGFALTGTETLNISASDVTLYALCTGTGSKPTIWQVSAKGRWK